MAANHLADHDRRDFLGLAACALGALAVGVRPTPSWAQATSTTPVRIGQVGAGRMGGALGELCVKAGNAVMLSSRHPDNIKPLATRLGPLAQVGTVDQAIAFGDVVVMVVPYSALDEIGKAHGPALATKLLILDICNPIARRDGETLVKSVQDQGGPGLASAKLLHSTRIVRAFNAISYRKVVGDAHRQPPVGVPIAGDDPQAIALAERIIRGMGFEPVLVGGLAMGKYLVPGTPLAEEHTPDEIRKIAAGLH